MNKNYLMLALLAGVLLGCGKKTEEQKSGPTGTPISVAQVEARTMEIVEESVGVLESQADPIVAAEVAGKVLEIRVQPGSEVKAGQVLALLDGQDVSLARQAAQADARRAEAQFANQTRNLERLKQLREKNFISQAALDEATTQHTASQEQLNASRAQLGLAEHNVGKSAIVSPVDGRVEKLIAARGQFLKVGDAAFQVVSLKKMRARLPFPESMAGRIRRGMTLHLTNQTGQTLDGKVEEIRPMAGSMNRSFDVFMTFDNPGDWKPGGTVTGAVVLGSHADALTVPEQAVVLRPAGKVVYAVKNGKAVQNVVETGGHRDNRVEVLSGLTAGETVAVDGAGFLTDQAPVLVPSKPAAPASAPQAVSAAQAASAPAAK